MRYLCTQDGVLLCIAILSLIGFSKPQQFLNSAVVVSLHPAMWKTERSYSFLEKTENLYYNICFSLPRWPETKTTSPAPHCGSGATKDNGRDSPWSHGSCFNLIVRPESFGHKALQGAAPNWGTNEVFSPKIANWPDSLSIAVECRMNAIGKFIVNCLLRYCSGVLEATRTICRGEVSAVLLRPDVFSCQLEARNRSLPASSGPISDCLKCAEGHL